MAHHPEPDVPEVLSDLIETADAAGVPVFCIVAGTPVVIGPNALPEEVVRVFLIGAGS